MKPEISVSTRDPATGRWIPQMVTDGANGWTPVYMIEEDGTARYIRITDWVGGTGAKPATGYMGVNGIGTKANASNLNAAKRTFALTAVSNAQGIATFTFNQTPPFTNPPRCIVISAITAVAGVQVKTTEIITATPKLTIQYKVEQIGILSGILSLLVGATVTILVIET